MCCSPLEWWLFGLKILAAHTNAACRMGKSSIDIPLKIHKHWSKCGEIFNKSEWLNSKQNNNHLPHRSMSSCSFCNSIPLILTLFLFSSTAIPYQTLQRVCLLCVFNYFSLKRKARLHARYRDPNKKNNTLSFTATVLFLISNCHILLYKS